jgi:Spy/CpxP family protein refolding chaperone
MVLHVLRALDLTEEQRTAIKEILQNEDAQAARKAAAEALHEATETLHEATRAVAEGEQGATAEAINDAAVVLGQAMATQASLHAETLASIKGLLTEEQLAKLAQIKEKGTAIREKLSDPDVREALKMMHGIRGRGGRGGRGLPGRRGFDDRSGFRGGPGRRMPLAGPGDQWGPGERGPRERFGGRFGR